MNLFHLLFGILFTFHLQYTNRDNNPLGNMDNNVNMAINMATEEIHHLYNSVLTKDLKNLRRGIFSIN